jgi:uncharacterized YigZ family protein
MDYFLTISAESESLYKEKGSKFIGYAIPVTDESQVKEHLERLAGMHHQSRHVCYAYRLGADLETYRINDDGEPSGSAGQPIFGQIRSFELTNVLVAVVRYFGGTKLGVGGLIQAYKTAANDALEQAKIIKEYIPVVFTAKFEYARMGDVMGTVEKYNWNVVETDFQLSCKLTFSCKISEQEQAMQAFEPLHDVEILIING